MIGRPHPTRPATLIFYVASVCVLGAAAFAGTLGAGMRPTELSTNLMIALAFLAVFALVGELKPIWLAWSGQEIHSLSLGTPAVLAILAIAGPAPAIFVQAISTLADDIRGRRAWYKAAFNIAQYSVSIAAAGAVYEPLAATIEGDHVAVVHAQRVGALLVSGLVMIMLNWLLVGVAVTLASGEPLRATLASGFGYFVATHAVMLSLGCIAADVAPHGVGVLVMLVPAAVAAHYFAVIGARHAYDASHDQLTGLRNRGQLRVKLERDLAAEPDDRYRGPGLVLIDLDHFKVFNDTLGHPVGDAILCEVARRLDGGAPLDAVVHRLGGDEFAIVADGTIEQLRSLASEVLATLEEPVQVDDLELLVRASAGLAVAPMHGSDVDTLMKNADIALYHAKLERDRISIFSPEFDLNTVERLRLLADLRIAIDRGDLDVVFQPQVELAGSRVVAVEALARWNHCTRGPVGPDVFIPLAEDSGLIFRLTTVVLERALAQLAEWRAAGHDIRMAVNLSARHLSDLGVPQQVALALRRHGIPASSLVLEVTETAILSDPVRADLVIRALRAHGVTIAIDDYGTGNASLSYLRRLEVDELKIDRVFVSNIRADGQDMIIVRSTIALALELGLRVVAEGVEDEPTVESLRSFGGVVAQGYHLGRPGSAEAVERMIVEANGAPTEGALSRA
ncbi:putative bifunctional diguanylate cyclase/phosphodiesterase [Demequina mangrovi]|uniref:Diguanylate cyclase (GGDEF) domain-containing protein n=1 Tax=Demequina mangrovi TaxID=1043493 RepID=A0A1H7A5W6_9MICO|nr:bifunctional diguanylate cyclase/phosphodiesterase [Demequina mangrovi]SEJ59814.1 diguanylate cyclase (GGDEF) domain-containing protein [Demequina mangrovi]